jgi:hypothetical protein
MCVCVVGVFGTKDFYISIFLYQHGLFDQSSRLNYPLEKNISMVCHVHPSYHPISKRQTTTPSSEQLN